MNIIKIILVFLNLLNNDFYEIQYEFTQKMEISEEGRRQYSPEILEQVLEAANASYIFKMYTNGEESLIKIQPKIFNTQAEMNVEIEPDFKWVYKNLKEDYILSLVEFDKNYYVKDTMQSLDWQKSSEIKEILGHQTTKFLYENEDRLFEIWCADDIEIPNGPLNFSGNTHLILEASISAKEGWMYVYNFKASKINYPVRYNLKKEMPKKIIEKKEFDEIENAFYEKENLYNEEVDKD